MRPTKLTPHLLEAYRAVLADELAAIAFTEEELVWQANQRLQPDDRISYRTYQRYKADILYSEAGEPSPNLSQRERDCPAGEVVLSPQEQEQELANAELVRQMYATLKDAMMKQKLALVRGVCEGQPNWRRYSWMLERKFPDFRLKALTEALAKQPKPNEGHEENKERKEAAIAEEAQKRREAYFAKVEAAKAEKEERLKDPVYKWNQCGYTPFMPVPKGYCSTMYPEELRELEEEMARDVAAGYEDPYAHLGYRPDPVERTGGHYLIMGMGPDRLPLLAHVYRSADAPNEEEREERWLAQEQQRRNIIRAEQGLPPENLPEPPEHAPKEHYTPGRSTIYGHSGMAA